MNPRSTDCEADALTTTPSRRLSYSVTHFIWSAEKAVHWSVYTLVIRWKEQQQNEQKLFQQK